MNPLRGVVTEASDLFQAHERRMAGLTIAVYLPLAIVEIIIDAVIPGVARELITAVAEALALCLAQAAVVTAVHDWREGHRALSLGETLSRADKATWRVFGATAMAALGTAAGLALVVVPGLYLATIWALIVPVIVIERSGMLGSFRRSRDLVSGVGWRVFGALLMVYLTVLAAGIALGVVLWLIMLLVPLLVGRVLVIVVAGGLGMYLTLAVTLIYYRLASTGAPDGGLAARTSGNRYAVT